MTTKQFFSSIAKQYTLRFLTLKKTSETMLIAFAIIGAGLVALNLLRFLYNIFVYTNRRLFKVRLELQQFLKRYPDRWAMVTGATDGIGQSYAKCLVRYGFNVVIVGRNEQKLSNTEALLRQVNSKISVRQVLADFSSNTPELYSHIEKSIEDVDVAVLVNNVGISYDRLMDFDQVPDDEQFYSRIINTNIASMVHMTRIVVKRMLKLPHKCYVINMSSISGEMSTPYLPVYAGSKGFCSTFTKSLQLEFHYDVNKNVEFQSVCPGLVATKMVKSRESNFFVPGPDSFADDAISTIGYLSKSYGCLSHYLQSFVLAAMPYSLKIPQIRRIKNDQRLAETMETMSAKVE